VNALEERPQDFLGEIFIDGEFRNTRTAQFFTPFHISQFMAEAAIGELPENEICKVCDPCCGSGVMLIASIAVLKEREFNYQRNAFFLATDIDARCARMAYIQLSLLGAPAVVICGNTLTRETFWERETIGYFMSGMKFRLLKSKETEEPSEPVVEEQHEKAISQSGDCVQGELF